MKYNKPVLITKNLLDANRRVKYLDDLIGNDKDGPATTEQPASIQATEVAVAKDSTKEVNRDSVIQKVSSYWAKHAPYPIDQTTAGYSKQFYEFLEMGFIYVDCDEVMALESVQYHIYVKTRTIRRHALIHFQSSFLH